MNDEAAPTKSYFNRFEKPTFKSSIPPHLLSRANATERYVVGSLSKMEQQHDWLIETTLETNNNLIDVDSRLRSVERWKLILTSKWAVILGVFGFITWLVQAIFTFWKIFH